MMAVQIGLKNMKMVTLVMEIPGVQLKKIQSQMNMYKMEPMDFMEIVLVNFALLEVNTSQSALQQYNFAHQLCLDKTFCIKQNIERVYHTYQVLPLSWLGLMLSITNKSP